MCFRYLSYIRLIHRKQLLIFSMWQEGPRVAVANQVGPRNCARPASFQATGARHFCAEHHFLSHRIVMRLYGVSHAAGYIRKIIG